MSSQTNPLEGLLPYDATKPISFPADDQKILEFWREIDAFQTGQKITREKLENWTDEQKEQDGFKGEYRFYDGPPFATGLPHYGHLLCGTIKDMITRYAYTTGHHVERRFGWDTHGLPVEHQIDKIFNITSKQDVLDMTIEKYNKECRSIVMKYQNEWEAIVEKMGRWIDFKNGYKTMDPTFMESTWWVFGQLWEKGMVYRGLRVMPYSTGCTTPLSNFEAGDDYRDVDDPAVTVAFPLIDEPETSLLAWTTTPWTLPSNLALCVNPTFTYVKIHDLTRDRNFIMLESLIGTLFKELSGGKKQDPKNLKYKVIGKYKGEDMKGWRYTPIFDYFTEQFEDRAFRIICDEYVEATSGTGIVHQAPAFGEDDHRISISNGIVAKDEMPPCPIDDAGRFTKEIVDFEGQHVKEADKNIMKYLKANGRMIVQSTIKHSYPFCWRSGTPLIYRAIPVWFVKVENIKDQLVTNNEETYWVPSYVRDGRFGGWLRNARDWNISRNRYWGTPIPLWTSEDYEEIVCVSSVEQLKELSGRDDITDLHRENIDPILIPSKKGKGMLKRIEEVFDCWFESGSMPYAQRHYPFENPEKFHDSFPADFVSEGIDQTRGWFYTLLVLGTHLFGTAPWKNLIVHGLVLGSDGKKMSKKLKNYPDPDEIMNKYGSDALRLYLVNSPVVRGDNLIFRDDGVRDVRTAVITRWVNSLRFFLGQAELFERTHGKRFVFNPAGPQSKNVMDKWILARCQSLIKHVKQEMDAYRLYTVLPRVLELVAELTNWYIRFNRLRLKGEGGLEDTVAALNTLYETLDTLCLTLSSFTPFTAENSYHALIPHTPAPADSSVDVRSVHFRRFPSPREEYFDETIQRQVKRMQAVIDLTRFIRDRKKLPVKQPLKELIIFHHDAEYLSDVKSLEKYVQEELNVFEVTLTSDEQKVGIRYKAGAEWSTLGKKLRKDIGRVKAGLPKLTSEQVKDYAKTGKISVDGIELVEGDLVVTRYVDATGENFESNTDNDVVVLLDIKKYAELEIHALRRELTNRCQQLRKTSNLLPADKVDIYYDFVEGMEDSLKDIISGHEEVFTKKVGAVPRRLPAGEELDIWSQEQNKAAEGEGEEAAVSAVGYTLYVTRPARTNV